MRTALAVVLVSTLALGQDALLIDGLPPRGRVVELDAGTVLEFDATCLDKQQAKRQAMQSVFDRTALEKAHEGKVLLPTPAFVAIVLGVAAVVAAGTVAVVKVTEKKP